MKGVPRLIRVGNLFGFTGGSFAGMVYSPCGLCPTINTSGGGQREPMITEYETSDDSDAGAE
jgi:hypothetical protein